MLVKADAAFGRLGLAASDAGPGGERAAVSRRRALRIEIPSVENLRVLEAVLDAARRHGIVVNRVSQGSGAMLLAEAELREMAVAGAEAGVEVSLFVGPARRTASGRIPARRTVPVMPAQLRGVRGLSYAIEDVLRAAEAGIRAF